MSLRGGHRPTKQSVSIILVEPENPDNIGAVARAMKNMALADLRLVKPPKHWRRLGKKMAMSGLEVLKKAGEFKTLKQAVSDVRLVIGTTRRKGPKRGQFIDFDGAIQKLTAARPGFRTALVFGKESKGLDNLSLRLCDRTVMIPANPDYPSLNLAQAVMVFAFSIFSARGGSPPKADQPLAGAGIFGGKTDYPPPLQRESFVSKKETEEVLVALKSALKALGYDSGRGLLERVKNSFHRLLKRNGLLESEARMFKGLTRRIVQKLKD